MNRTTSQTYTTCGSTFQKSLENEGKYASRKYAYTYPEQGRMPIDRKAEKERASVRSCRKG